MKLLSVKQAAEFLNLEKGWLDRDRQRDEGSQIPFSRIGGLIRYDQADLERFVLDQKGNK